MTTQKIKLISFAVTLVFLPLLALTQDKNQQNIIDNLCKKWVVDSIEINDMKKKFAPPANIKDNYADYKKDGTFQIQDFEVVVKGKWKLDFEKKQIINYDMDNPLLKEDIVFTIVEITNTSLAITSRPMSGNQVTMHYKPNKE